VRGLSILLLVQTACAAGFAHNLPFGELGRPFRPGTNLVVFWNAPTNELPADVWVYRVLPSHFSPAVISNLTVLGSFTEKDRSRTPALNPVFNQPGGLMYRSADGNRELYIFPNLGWIYYDDAAVSSSHTTNGVPKAESETLDLAIGYLKQFGIDRSQLATKPQSADLAASYIVGKLTVFDTNKTHFTFVNLRGVMVARKIDGVDFGQRVRGTVLT